MIQIKDLSFTYPRTQNETLSQLNFNIERGEIFGFLGPSGAGKTTTQRLLIGLLRGYQGSIQIMEKERNKWDKNFYEQIGVAFDFPNLFMKLTASENLKLIQSYYKNRSMDTDALLNRVGLLPDRDKKVEGFSKGMKMRLNFIRSIMHEPELMFFDEPTSGLDPVNAKIIKDIILGLKAEGKTIFLTTHNMQVAETLCDHVAFIVDGKISVVDQPKNLMLKYGVNRVNVEFFEDHKVINKSYELSKIGSSEEFFEILRTKTIRTIHSQEASLEEIFIQLTGRNLL